MYLLLNYILWVLFIHVCFVFFLVLLCSCEVMLMKVLKLFLLCWGQTLKPNIKYEKQDTPLLQWRQTTVHMRLPLDQSSYIVSWTKVSDDPMGQSFCIQYGLPLVANINTKSSLSCHDPPLGILPCTNNAMPWNRCSVATSKKKPALSN